MNIRAFITRAAGIVGVDPNIKRFFSIKEHEALIYGKKPYYGNGHEASMKYTELKLKKQESIATLKYISKAGNVAILTDGQRITIKSKKDPVLTSKELVGVEYDSVMSLAELKKASFVFRSELEESVQKAHTLHTGKFSDMVRTYSFRHLKYTVNYRQY